VGAWDRARVELERVLELDAGNLSAARNLAVLEARDGNLERARTLLRPVVEALPQDEEAILLLADIESQLGDSADATRVLEQALQRNPQAASVITQLAEVYFRDKRYTDILTITGKLSNEQLGKRPRLLELRGRAQMLSGDAPAAARSFEQLVQAVPDSVQARHVYADSLLKAGERKRGQQEMQLIVEMDPDYLPARLGQVRLLAESGKRGQALEAMAEVEKKFGEKPEILALHGWLSLLEGDYAAAEARLAKANEQLPDTDQTGYLVKALWEQKKYDEAIRVMQDWLERYPRDLAVRLRLAGGYLSLAKMTEARSSYAAIVEYYPNYVPALNNLAFLLGQEGDLKQAIGYAERAYALSPADPTVLDTLGTLLLKDGDVTRGYGLLRKAAERSPKDLEIQLHLGEALVQRKQYDEARQVLNGIVATGPDSQSAVAAKALLESMPR
jgi:putative PEP-CTERM system TPR-repeat lipoprotein